MKKAASIIFRSFILILLGVAIGLYLADSPRRVFPFATSKVSKVLQLVHRNYVDSVNVDSLEGVTANNLLQTLDPHSLYLPPQQAQSINERLDGSFNGVGLEYQLLRDTLFVTQVYAEGPAAKAGIKPGDKVVDVDNKSFSGTHLTVDKANE